MKDRIRTVRKNANLNQTEFADLIGASRDKVASYETGRVDPPDTVLRLISKEFHVSYAWLTTGIGPMEDETEISAADQLIDTYSKLPDRLRSLVDALALMDPEWYKTLDKAFEEIEKRKKGKGDAD